MQILKNLWAVSTLFISLCICVHLYLLNMARQDVLLQCQVTSGLCFHFSAEFKCENFLSGILGRWELQKIYLNLMAFLVVFF